MNQRLGFAPALAVLLGLAALGCEEGGTGLTTPLPRPTGLQSISLNRAVHLTWSDAPFQSDPDRFAWYQVYSTSYNLDTVECGLTWSREGTTIGPAFLVSALPNGTPRCFSVSTVSVEGSESARSLAWQDTPRPDARNVLVHPIEGAIATSGFRFWDDDGDGIGEAGELGLVVRGDDANADFRVYRDATDTLWIEPVFTGTRVQVYGQVEDLTGIDFAPETGYSRAALQAIPTFGYAFEIVEQSNVWYGGVRVAHMGRDYVILDWSFQTDPGNPELVGAGGMPRAVSSGSAVP